MSARIDIHTHLAGMGSEQSGCRVSPRMRRTLTYHAMMWATGARGPAARGREDARYAERLAAVVEGANELDHACLFALDGAYDVHGDLDLARSHLVVPNAHLFSVCRNSERLLPVISINPDRRDAIAELERWGPSAVALKWLAPLQGFRLDPLRHARFIALLRELELVVIAHTGCEHTFPGMDQSLGDPEIYEPLLAKGIPVVFSHCGTGTWRHPGFDFSRGFARMLDRYDHAYGDSSAFSSMVRVSALRRLRLERFAARILHGSDYPIPPMAWVFWRDLGLSRLRAIQAVSNPLDRDVLLKRAMGMPEASFHAAADLLGPGIARWRRASAHP